MKITLIKEYATRTELEQEISKSYGLTPDFKAGVQIAGTREELEKLSLSDETTFHGISCVITDSPTISVEPTTVDRGEQSESGINLQDNQ